MASVIDHHPVEDAFGIRVIEIEDDSLVWNLSFFQGKIVGIHRVGNAVNKVHLLPIRRPIQAIWQTARVDYSGLKFQHWASLTWCQHPFWHSLCHQFDKAILSPFPKSRALADLHNPWCQPTIDPVVISKTFSNLPQINAQLTLASHFPSLNRFLGLNSSTT